MKIKMTKKRSALFVFVVNMLLFILLTAPFKLWAAASEITQMRPTAALTPVLGMIFGWPAALGCAAGNFICDLSAGYEVLYAALNSLLQILYAMCAYFFWKKINRERGGREFRLNSVSRILKFCLLLGLNAILTVLFTSVLNHAYNVTDIVSLDNLYLFINSFDAGLLFGTPLLILGSFLQMRLDNLRNGGETKTVNFSMNERMILNTLVTGICICLLVGTIVYLSDKYGSGNISVLGKIYIFETLAMNIYFALSVGFMHFTERRISRPIEELAKIAGSYYSGQSTDMQRSKMLSDCEAYAEDSTEVGELARSYMSMIRDLGSYVDNLRSAMAEKERINAELRLASDIQAHMLPCIFPPFPEHCEFELYAVMHPAKEVGGDFYDFFMIGEDKLALVIADVSGKGVPAALFMVIAKTLIKNHTQTGMTPAEVFTTVNRLLCDGNDAGLFVTAWMGILDINSGELTYVNAGHNPPLIKRADGRFEYLRKKGGLVLAGMDDTKYRQETLTVKSGDRLFLYTDGVTETADAQHRLYGEERLKDFLNAHSSDETEMLLNEVLGELQLYAGGEPQFDDITMLLMDFKDTRAEAKRSFEAKVENIEQVLDFVGGELERAGCSPKLQTPLCVAIEELFANIASYAYPDSSGSATICVGIDDDTDTATFTVSDTGIAFDPLAKAEPDITLPAEEREVGGLGILIVKKTMDTLTYSRENGENRLKMTKRLERRTDK